MFIVSLFKLNHNKETGYFSVTPDNPEDSVLCPLCGGGLFYRNSKPRNSISLLGEVCRFLLRRFKCKICNKLHTEIPSIIQPFKHYDSRTIQSVLDGSEDAELCVADDSTIRRWKSTFADAEPDITQRLASVYAQETDEMAPIGSSSLDIMVIKSMIEHWLAFVMALLINRGHGLCTRFAFCPSPSACNIKETGQIVWTGGRINDQTIKDSS